ncbi:MAG: dioxygenase, partial [Bacteroidota bacterium]
IYPIDNPNQIASYHYGQDVLVGTTKELKQKSPPGFERGKLICANGLTTLYVSGTASILGENTVGHNDIKKQTITTINNINLIQKEAAQKQNRNFSEANQLKHIRVYIKEQKDFQLIKEICTKAYGEIPIVYVIADVCRQDLLIEIEAEYGN